MKPELDKRHIWNEEASSHSFCTWMCECESGVFGPFISWIVAWGKGYREYQSRSGRLYSKRKGPYPRIPLASALEGIASLIWFRTMKAGSLGLYIRYVLHDSWWGSNQKEVKWEQVQSLRRWWRYGKRHRDKMESGKPQGKEKTNLPKVQ
jgi:hypothetical protein